MLPHPDQKADFHIYRTPPNICMKWFVPASAHVFVLSSGQSVEDGNNRDNYVAKNGNKSRFSYKEKKKKERQGVSF